MAKKKEKVGCLGWLFLLALIGIVAAFAVGNWILGSLLTVGTVLLLVTVGYISQLWEERKLHRYIEQQERKRLRLRTLTHAIRREILAEQFPELGSSRDRPRQPIPPEIQEAVYERDGGACVLCGSTEDLQFDHIIPHSKGGADTFENLRLLCRQCNLQKRDRFL